MITSLSATGTRDGGVGIVFTLSADATVEAQVLNVAGRVVRHLAVDRNLTGGTNTLHWDGRGDAGTQVPAGRYLVQLTATREDGQRLSRIGTVAIRQ